MKTLTKIVALAFLVLGLNAPAQNYQNPAVYTDSPFIGTSAGNLYVNAGTQASATSVWELKNVCIDVGEIPVLPVPALPPGLLFGAFSNTRWSVNRGSLPYTGFNIWSQANPAIGEELNNGYIIRFEFPTPYALDPNIPEGYVIGAFEYWDAWAGIYRDYPLHAPIGSRYVDWFIGWNSYSGPTIYMIGGSGDSGSAPDPSTLYSPTGINFILDDLAGAIWPGGLPNWSNCSCNGVGPVWTPISIPLSIYPIVAYKASN